MPIKNYSAVKLIAFNSEYYHLTKKSVLKGVFVTKIYQNESAKFRSIKPKLLLYASDALYWSNMLVVTVLM